MILHIWVDTETKKVEVREEVGSLGVQEEEEGDDDLYVDLWGENATSTSVNDGITFTGTDSTGDLFNVKV